MKIERQAGITLSAVEMDIGDELVFRLVNGECRRIVLLSTRAWVSASRQGGGVALYEFHCALLIDGMRLEMVRQVPSPKSFYAPAEISGLRIWFDAVDDVFDFLSDDHGGCRPGKKARFAVQDASLRICPPLLHPWCPLPADGLRIGDCYNGEDVWMGPYGGKEAHGGLDINHPAGTPLWTPVAIDEHELFDSVDAGANNNRWRGLRRWENGATWILQSHHVIHLCVPLDRPIAAGVLYARGAGVLTGSHEHSHFKWIIREHGGEIALDPWILFQQMYADRKLTAFERRP